MENIKLFGLLLLVGVSIWLLLSVLYMLFYSIAAFFYKSKTKVVSNYYPRIAVLIPAYKEDVVIVETAKKALRHLYPGEFEVVIIADSLKDETIDELLKLPVNLLVPYFNKSTKAKALMFAMEFLDNEYEMAIVLDADNIMAPQTMVKMACKYGEGYHAIQGHRCAKNKNTQFAYLDAISEEVNNHIYCKGPSAVGLSSRLVGSGMAFDYSLFKRLIRTINAVGGFDKELEMKLIQEGVVIQYLDSALIYDEKVSKSEVFEKQRTRWISAQYHFMMRIMPGACIELFKGNLDYFYKALQLTLPPRLLLPGVLLIGSIVLQVFEVSVLANVWTAMFIGNVIAYSLAIPNKFWNKKLWFGFLALPKAFFITIKAVLNSSGANEKFIHTPHTAINSGDLE
ncbi:MAG: glycosyltransferase [Flavobacteriales bacterium]|nr:glycosyltransferase [Flavobacteriales bacterium]